MLQRIGEGIGDAIYNYNSQGVRISKLTTRSGVVTTNYFHDGDKLIEEHRGTTQIRYLYDTDGIMGFSIGNSDYYFVKDGEGSVRVILRGERNTVNVNAHRNNFTVLTEVARYSYDAWGNATEITTVGNRTIDNIPVADFNPIRWKSQYFDTETGFYAMSGGSGTRYYSPQMRQFISPESYEGMMANAGVIYGLNPYLLCVDNPVSLSYNGHTIATNGELAFEPDELTSRQMRWFRIGRFFGTPEGRVFAIKMFVAAIALIILTGGKFAVLKAMFFTGMSRASLMIGGAIVGRRARDSGGCFNEAFTDHINNNWAMSMAISSVLVIGMVGVGLAVGGIAGAVGSKRSKLVNAVATSNEEVIPWNSWANYEKVTIKGQEYARVGKRLYSKHAVDRMQPSGNKFGKNIYQAGEAEIHGRSIAPAYVESVIKSTKAIYQSSSKNFLHVSGSVTVVVNKKGYVVTIITK